MHSTRANYAHSPRAADQITSNRELNTQGTVEGREKVSMQCMNMRVCTLRENACLYKYSQVYFNFQYMSVCEYVPEAVRIVFYFQPIILGGSRGLQS